MEQDLKIREERGLKNAEWYEDHLENYVNFDECLASISEFYKDSDQDILFDIGHVKLTFDEFYEVAQEFEDKDQNAYFFRGDSIFRLTDKYDLFGNYYVIEKKVYDVLDGFDDVEKERARDEEAQTFMSRFLSERDSKLMHSDYLFDD